MNDKIEKNISSQIGEEDTWLDKGKTLVRQNKIAAFSALVILLILLAAIFAPLVAPYDHLEQSLADRLKDPSAAHWLGTDELGRDVLSRIIFGARISLTIGLVPTLISMAIGTVLGLCAGFYGGKTDFIIMRLADVMLAFPSLLLAMVVMYTMGGGLVNIFIALSLVNWAGTARIVRSQTLSLKEKEFVEAARSMGVGKWTIMFRHILPNCLPSLIVLFTLNIPAAILSEASLSFLGIGAQPPSPSWGLMAVRGKKYLFSEPWLSIAPSAAIMVVVLAFNFLGDGLRDILDPYLKEQ
ncbi:MAG: ABC transporter permease [Lachnospiraceae bacterium]|nr:ABC transporter permease [Lachnospiraceae bacterium]MCI9185233.1 ABC transporter permease [Lachnospiraceae bacterium]